MTRALREAERRFRIESVLLSTLDEMSELEASVTFADFREDGEADAEMLAELLEVPVAAVQATRRQARARMLTAVRGVTHLEDWSALRRAMGMGLRVEFHL
ncbi:MAG: hypothetical protein GY711_24505 [bacterium]|nr:hypothetical protein [bacterium]